MGGEGGAGTVHFFIHRQVYSIALELEVREAACQQAGGGGGGGGGCKNAEFDLLKNHLSQHHQAVTSFFSRRANLSRHFVLECPEVNRTDQEVVKGDGHSKVKRKAQSPYATNGALTSLAPGKVGREAISLVQLLPSDHFMPPC